MTKKKFCKHEGHVNKITPVRLFYYLKPTCSPGVCECLSGLQWRTYMFVVFLRPLPSPGCVSGWKCCWSSRLMLTSAPSQLTALWDRDLNMHKPHTAFLSLSLWLRATGAPASLIEYNETIYEPVLNLCLSICCQETCSLIFVSYTRNHLQQLKSGYLSFARSLR